MQDSTLYGDLYCVGGFDPAFNSDDMRAFAESVQQMGIDTIRGRIVADRTMKDGDLLGEGWCWDDDNPKISPLSLGRDINFLSVSSQHSPTRASVLTSGSPREDSPVRHVSFAAVSTAWTRSCNG